MNKLLKYFGVFSILLLSLLFFGCLEQNEVSKPVSEKKEVIASPIISPTPLPSPLPTPSPTVSSKEVHLPSEDEMWEISKSEVMPEDFESIDIEEELIN